MIKTLLRVSVTLLLWTCTTVPEPSSRLYYISSSTNNTTRRPASDCTFRYKFENPYAKLDNQTQQNAIREAFDLWQKGNSNVAFIQRQDAQVTEIKVRFVGHSEIAINQRKSEFGLIKGDIPSLSAVREENSSYIILLDSDFQWNGQAITRVMAYHIGIFLGLNTSPESNSIMNSLYKKGTSQLSDDDLQQVKTLYPAACSVSCNNFLRMDLDVAGEITKSIKLDKQGTVSIIANGKIWVGATLQNSSPMGLEKGRFNWPIEQYNIVAPFNHASLMYKINGEPNWRNCGASCEFETDGVSQCMEITLGINDNNLTDNSGAYQVSIDYK